MSKIIQVSNNNLPWRELIELTLLGKLDFHSFILLIALKLECLEDIVIESTDTNQNLEKHLISLLNTYIHSDTKKHTLKLENIEEILEILLQHATQQDLQKINQILLDNPK